MLTATKRTATRLRALQLQRRSLRDWPQSREDVSFQFKCTQCGRCCTGKGGRVRVNEREIEEIAAALHGSSVQEVKAQYLRRETVAAAGDSPARQWWFLKQTPDDAQCIFLDGSRCSIYRARPTQCRTFPWWPQNLVSDYDWQLAARDCEGIALAAPDAAPTSTDTYRYNDILPDVILHDIHSSGENFTYDELQEMLSDLQEVDADFMGNYKSELSANYRREIVHRDESVTVLDTFLRDVERSRGFVFNDRIHLVQSEVALLPGSGAIDRSALVLDVHRAMCMALAMRAGNDGKKEEALRVAVIGSGAASVPLFLLEHVDEITHLDAVEPDATVNRVAREFFGLGEAEKHDSRLQLHELMGEVFVDEQRRRGTCYDLLMLDVESGDDGDVEVKAPPASMLTPAFLGSLRELLAPSSGVLVVNVIAETPAALKRAEQAFASVFSSGGVVVELRKNAVFYLFADRDATAMRRNNSVGRDEKARKDELVKLLSQDAFQRERVQSPALLLQSAHSVRGLSQRFGGP